MNIDLFGLGLLVLAVGGVGWLVTVVVTWVVLHHYCGRNDDE
jgi:hypothetical protein